MKFDRMPLSKKESPIDKVVGATKDVEMGIHKRIDRSVKESVYSRTLLERRDQEFSAEHIDIIAKINVLMPRFLQEYGLEEALEIDMSRVYIFDGRSKRGAAGSYGFAKGKLDIGISHQYIDDYTIFAHVFSHETIHAQSFHALETDTSEAFYDSYRVVSAYDAEKDRMVSTKFRRLGFLCFDNEKGRQTRYFNWLNEAITERLTLAFLEKHTEDIPLPVGRESTWKQRLLMPYVSERLALDNLIKLLYSTGSYESEDEVFRLFTRAMFNGRLLPIARAIEKIRGKGAFRELASLKPSLIKEFLKNKFLY